MKIETVFVKRGQPTGVHTVINGKEKRVISETHYVLRPEDRIPMTDAEMLAFEQYRERRKRQMHREPPAA